MSFCAETGGNSGTGVDNTGAFGFLTFGGTVVNYTSSITSQSNSSIYNGGDYYVWPGTVAINTVFPTATGFIGYIDATPPPPASAFDWFLCNDDPSCGTQGIVCHQIMMEVTSMPDSIMLIGIEGSFDTVNDLISALGGNTGCPDLTVYPLPCGVPLPVELASFKANYEERRVHIYWLTLSEVNSDYFQVHKSTNGFDWSIVGVVNAAGFATSENFYVMYDNLTSSEEELIYYRLTQVDFDGNSNVYPSISLNRRAKGKNLIKRVNLLGVEVDENYNGIVILQFQDGHSEKHFQGLH
jgi:hypothetical protein